MHLPLATLALVTSTLVLWPDAPPATGGVEGTLVTDVKIATKGATSQRDVVLWLEPKQKPDTPPKPTPATVVQKKLAFEPHVLPVVRGSSVEFQNEDQVRHNVFVEAPCCKLDADTEKGEKRVHVFGEAGEFPIVCRLHPEMTMHVLVLDTPHFVRVELQKDKEAPEGKARFVATFKLENVPPGTYTLRTWNKRLKALERDIVVADGAPQKLELTLEK